VPNTVTLPRPGPVCLCQALLGIRQCVFCGLASNVHHHLDSGYSQPLLGYKAYHWSCSATPHIPHAAGNVCVGPPALFQPLCCTCTAVDMQAFFAQIYSEAQSSKAAPGHVAIAELHRMGRLQRHYTLNIDGLAAVSTATELPGCLLLSVGFTTGYRPLQQCLEHMPCMCRGYVCALGKSCPFRAWAEASEQLCCCAWFACCRLLAWTPGTMSTTLRAAQWRCMATSG
jgi:hypothetical protein